MNRRALAPVLIVVAGFGVAGLLIATGPQVEPHSPEQIAPLVRVHEVAPHRVTLRVSTHGTVAPRTESELVPEVSGRVLWISPALVSGGFFSEGEPLLRIDPLDYEVALEQARASLAQFQSERADARSDHRRQIDLASKNVASEAARDDAANRMRVSEATLRGARAALARAERDLARTEIQAPYDGRVRSKTVDVGQFVNRGAPVATVYAVDYAEVRLPVQDEELAFLDLPMSRDGVVEGSGTPVTLRARFAGSGHEWRGEVVRTEGEIDPQTRMVNVIARVADPYDAETPLWVGLFVEAEIEGMDVDDVVVLPRSALRGGDQVLVVGPDDKLTVRPVELLRVAADQVLIRAGLAAGERVCISPLESATEGMLVRVQPADESLAGAVEEEAGS
jgi:RND family efflux transporter MFP subunit